MDYNKYIDIRPLIPSEVPGAIDELLNNEAVKATFMALGTAYSWEQVEQILRSCQSVEEFKERFSAQLVRHIMRHTCHSVEPLLGTEHITSEGAYTYISNHRDIILDSAFLNVMLYDAGAKFPQIAIGDNLMVQPWVERLVKLNGSFLVKRNLQGREVLLAARLLSEYMHDAIATGYACWIAQREGRAKDSSDRTQPALLKMLSLGAGRRSGIVEALMPLNIVPVCCSYEYDPCDYLKAREMQLKRDLPDYRKSKGEDALNMRTGVMGYKGRVSFSLGRPLAHLVERVDWAQYPEAEHVEVVARLIDEEIHRHYRLYPGNYIALDLLEGGALADSTLYSREDIATFEGYLAQQLARIEMPEGVVADTTFLRERLLEMYANPTRNYLRATANDSQVSS